MTIKIPKYLYRYCRGENPLQNICELDPEVAEDLLATEDGWRGDGTYLTARRNIEKWMRSEFIRKGGKPIRDHPVYLSLGYDFDYRQRFKEFKIPLSIFYSYINMISFTYMDSMHTEKGLYPAIYTLNEINLLIKENYDRIVDNIKIWKSETSIEAQVWDDEPLKEYLKNM